MTTHFSRRILLLFAATAAVIPAGCDQQEAPGIPAAPSAPLVVTDATLEGTYGIAARVPRDVDGFSDFYKLGQLWSDFMHSRTARALMANPLVQQGCAQAMRDPKFQKAFQQWNANPEAVKWRAILADAFAHEFSVTLGKGAAARFASLQEFSNEMRVQQFVSNLNTVSGKPRPNPSADFLKALPSLAARLPELDVPPLIFEWKLASQRAALQAELDRAEAQLPPDVEKGTVTAGGSAFKTLVFASAKMIPPAQQSALQSTLEKNTDPQTARAVFQWVMARRVELAYGFVGDDFVLSVGPDHSHLKFAANIDESLLSVPEVAARAKQFVKQRLVGFSWQSESFVALSVQRAQLAPLVQREKLALQDKLPPADLEKLQADAERLDAKARLFLPQTFSPMVAIAYRENGIRTETFGGAKAPGAPPVKPLQFGNVPLASTFLWIDAQVDPAVTRAEFDWIEDLFSTAYDYAQRYALAQLPDAQKIQAGVVQNLVVPKLVDLFRITRDEFAKSLGSETAYALDLNGAVPPLPNIPPAVQQGGKIPRLAFLATVADRALLGKSWADYFSLARDIALMLPPQMQPKGGVQQPNETTEGTLTIYSYNLPMAAGDLQPNIAISNGKVFIASTSPAFARELAAGAEKGAAEQGNARAVVRLQLTALNDFAQTWLGVAAQNPQIVFGTDAAKRDQFLKIEPDLSKLLRDLRAFSGIDVRGFEEDGVPRSTTILHFNDAEPAAK